MLLIISNGCMGTDDSLNNESNNESNKESVDLVIRRIICIIGISN